VYRLTINKDEEKVTKELSGNLSKILNKQNLSKEDTDNLASIIYKNTYNIGNVLSI
jgi:hypothetical protein